MAEDTTSSNGGTQDPSAGAASPGAGQIPDWLKKAQALAEHEEKGVQVLEQKAEVSSPSPSLEVHGEVSTAATALPLTSESASGVVANDLPDWLKKIQEAPITPVTSSVQQGEVPVASVTPVIVAQAPVEAVPLVPEVQNVVATPMPVEVKPDILSETLKVVETPTQIVPEAVPREVGRVESNISMGSSNESVEKTSQTDAPKAQAPVDQKVLEKQKKSQDFFGNMFASFSSVMKKGQTAGAPKKVEEAVSGGTENVSKNTKKVSVSKASLEEQKKLMEAEKIFQQGIATIRDLIAPSSMEIRYDMLRVEGMFAQSFYVYAYPRYLDTNWLSPIVNYDVTMDIAQFIYPIESATIMRILKKKVAQMQSSVRMNAEKGMVSDPALETALQDADELRTQIQRGQEKFFQFALYFTIYSDDEKKIQKVAKQLESILGGKLILTKKAEIQMEHGFTSTMPLCLDELEVTRNMNTSPLSSTFPFSSADLTSNEGILYGLNRHNDSLIIFDRFSLENANSVVFAKSGAGKSYAVKLEILRSMMVGTDVIVIDPENEYEALTQTVGGSYLRVSLTSDRRINPFDLPKPIDGDEVQPGDLLRSNIINLHGLLKIMLGAISPEEEGIMDKALIDSYALKGITMDLVDPSPFPPPTMEDLYDILSSMEGGLNLAQRLQKYTTGTYSGIFNKQTNVDLEGGLMVFCIRDLEDALRPIAMYIILNYIWARVRSKLKKRILVIDEAWTLMQYDDSARFLFGLVKRARKYYLGITTITQDVEDFVKSPFGKPVVTNSSMQMLLKQAPAAIDLLGKIFNLTEGEKYMLLNSGVGQGLFFAGLKHVAIQIIASYTEDKIVTTNPEEILRERAGEALNG